MKRKGFTLIELLVVVAIIALLISILLPSLARARELSKRAVCAANVRGIGQSCKIYANDFSEWWPSAPYNKSAFIAGTAQIAEIGPVRDADSGYPDDPVNDLTYPSIGMCFWIIIKSGGTTNKQFVCPSSSDSADDTANPMTYFDFAAGSNLSYGYQHPYGESEAVPTESLDPGMAVIADKCTKSVAAAIASGKSDDFMNDMVDWDPDGWKQVGSSHHSDGEGQNVLFQDGHASFEKKVACGLPLEIHPTTGTDPYEHPDLIYETAYDEDDSIAGGLLGGEAGAHPVSPEDSVITHSPYNP